MTRLLKRRPTPAAVIALIALVISASGTAVWAGLPLSPNSVKANHIANETVQTQDLGAKSVASSEILNGSIGGNEVADGSLSGSDIGAGAVTGSHVPFAGLTAAEIDESTLDLPSATVALKPGPEFLLDGVHKTVASADVSSGRNVVLATVHLFNNEGNNEQGSCELVADGQVITDVPVFFNLNERPEEGYRKFITLRAVHQANGTALYRMRCTAFDEGDISYQQGTMIVIRGAGGET